ncbi:carbohydrate ABC transporter permease [Pseudonocardia sp. MH-G8]|uniref:carbohydrate ABC transporter permease n=1 Tax=Pseudonocardia sp. MH-G8 TaxID=1854588 RepID=UPI000B9FBE2F|nr:carbohydrate ABC transporter permease [Pseudonocardia sp. MH-G8]OZM81416.1 sugar ABC transporter permease [Pseudonocardia sp. MH-G8]
MATPTAVAPVDTSAAAPGPAKRSGRWYEGGAAHVVLIVLLVVALYPIAYMFGTSFKSPEEILNNVNVLPRQFTPGNYPEGWSGIPGITFGRFFLNSAVIAIGVVVGNVVACALAAFAFARLRFPLRGLWFALMIGTLLLPHHVLIVPQYVLFNSLEWINTPLPLIVPKFLATDAFFVFLMVQFMRGIPRSLDEAAEIDGCGPYRRFFHIVLPLTKPALVTTAVFSFIQTWNDFFSQLVYLNDLEAYTVPIGLRLFLDSSGQNAVAPMFAMSVLSLVPVFLFFLVFQRLIVDGINTSGIKG